MSCAISQCAIVVAIAAFSAPFQVGAEPTHSAVTHEAVWLMKRVTAPALSPDGRWVVYSVAVPAYDERKEASDLWIVPADGSAAPRRLTFSRSGESGAKWSPDSRRIAFAAKREDDDVAQIYVLDVSAGGEARRITSWPLAAQSPVWGPDGRSIAFQAGAFRGAADAVANAKLVAQSKDPKWKVRTFETFPMRRWDRWVDDTRTHLLVVPSDGDGASRDLLANTQLAAQTGFGGPFGEGASENMEPAWSPDGRVIVFGATTTRDTSAYSTSDSHLFEVPASGGEPRQLTTGHDSYASPMFAPDGHSMCFRATRSFEVIYAPDRIMCAPWPWTGRTTSLTESFDRSVGEMAFAPDSKTLFLTAEDGGYVKVFSISTRGGEVEVLGEPHGVHLSIAAPVAPVAGFLVALWGSAIRPNEVVRIDVATGKETPLTRVNADAAAALDWQPLQEFWFTNAKGRQVHNFIALPPGFDGTQKYPLLVYIHGGFASMWRDAIVLRGNYHLLASPGYVVVMTDYRGSSGYGEPFTLDILGDPLRGPADDINRGADEAIKRYPFVDATRQAAMGGSYGGHLANWLEATTTRYRCLVSHAGLSSLQTQWGTSDNIRDRELIMGGPFWEKTAAWLDQSPIAHAKDFRTPILLSVGENDFRVPINNTLEMYAVLQRMRVPVRLLVWPDENHWIQKPENSRVFYREVADWLNRWLR